MNILFLFFFGNVITIHINNPRRKGVIVQLKIWLKVLFNNLLVSKHYKV